MKAYHALAAIWLAAVVIQISLAAKSDLADPPKSASAPKIDSAPKKIDSRDCRKAPW